MITKDQFETELAERREGLAPNGARYELFDTPDLNTKFNCQRTAPDGCQKDVIVGFNGQRFTSAEDCRRWAIADGCHVFDPTRSIPLSTRKEIV